jgi:hypothetical protein
MSDDLDVLRHDHDVVEPDPRFRAELMDRLRDAMASGSGDLGEREGAATDATVVGIYPSSDPRPARRWGVVLAVAAAALVLVGVGVLLRAATNDDAPGAVTPAGPRPSPTTDPAPPRSEGPTAVPPSGAPSTPEAGSLLPGLPDIPVFIYEDGRVIWPDVTASPSPSEPLGEIGPWNWFERRLTPDGLEFVRSEIRPGGRLDPAAPVPAPWRWYHDGERELPMGEYTRLEYPDLSWIPVPMWEDPEPTPFVSSHYAVCLSWADGDLTALLARLPAAVADPFAGANPAEPPPPTLGEGTGYRGSCFDLATDDAREVEAALDTAGVSRPNGDNVFFYFFIAADADPQSPDIVGFTPYLPHGNPVISRDVP